MTEAADVKAAEASMAAVTDAVEASESEPDDPATSSSVNVKSVSLPKVIQPMESTAAEIAAEIPLETDREVVESIKPFVSSHLDTQNLVHRFEGPNRQLANQRNAIAAAMGLSDGQIIADVGAGTGLFLKVFSDAVGKDGQVFAIEISPQLVEHLDERVAAQKLQNVQVVRNDARSLQLMTTRIDKAFLCETYHELEYPRNILASVFKALRPGGELVIVDFARDEAASRDWILENVRADQATFREEIEAAGFEFVQEVSFSGLEEHYLMTFRRPRL